MDDPILRRLEEEQRGSESIAREEEMLESKKLQVIRDSLSPLFNNIKMLAENKKDIKGPAEAASKVIRAIIYTITSKQEVDFQNLRRKRAVIYMNVKQLPELEDHGQAVNKEIAMLNVLIQVLEDQTTLLMSLESNLRDQNIEMAMARWKKFEELTIEEARLVNELKVDEAIIKDQIRFLQEKLKHAAKSQNMKKKAA